MRGSKKLALARRQLMLAKQTRREALLGLAHAVDREASAAEIARRGKALIDESGGIHKANDANELRNKIGFVAGLHRISRDAQDAHQDALDQLHWQSATLAKSQAKADRIETMAREARRELRIAIERKDQSQDAMARKLQNSWGRAGARNAGKLPEE